MKGIGRVADAVATTSWVMRQPATQKRMLYRLAESLDKSHEHLKPFAYNMAQSGNDRLIQIAFETLYGTVSNGTISGVLQAMATNGDWEAILQGIGTGMAIGGPVGMVSGMHGSDMGLSDKKRMDRTIANFEEGQSSSAPRAVKEVLKEQQPRWFEDVANPSKRNQLLDGNIKLQQKDLYEKLPRATKEFLATNWEATGERSSIFYFSDRSLYRKFIATAFNAEINANQVLPAGWRDPVSGQIFVDMSRPKAASEALHQTVIHEVTHGEMGRWLQEGDEVQQSLKVENVLAGFKDENGTPFTLPDGREILLHEEAANFADNYDSKIGQFKEAAIGRNAIQLADEMLAKVSEGMFSKNPNVWKMVRQKNPGMLSLMSRASDKVKVNHKYALAKSWIAHRKEIQKQAHLAESELADQGVELIAGKDDKLVTTLTGSEVIPIEAVRELDRVEQGSGGHDFWKKAVGKLKARAELKPGMRAQYQVGRKNQFQKPEIIEEINWRDGIVKFQDAGLWLPIEGTVPTGLHDGSIVGKGKGLEGKKLPEGFWKVLETNASGNMIKRVLKEIEFNMGEGNVLTIAYSNRVKKKGNNKVRVRNIIPLQWSVSQAGNLSVQGWDMTAVNYNIQKLYEGGFIENVDTFKTEMLERMQEIEQRVAGQDLTEVLDMLGTYKIKKGPDDVLAGNIFAALGTPPAVLAGVNPNLARYMEATGMKHVKGGKDQSTFKGFRAPDLYSVGALLDKQGNPMKGTNFPYHNIAAAMKEGQAFDYYSPMDGMRPQLQPGEQPLKPVRESKVDPAQEIPAPEPTFKKEPPEKLEDQVQQVKEAVEML